MPVIITHSTLADGTFSPAGATAWDANHTVSGLGTLADQNANNVNITGGAINDTAVGATSASSGAFTTLSASSTVSGTGFSTYLASPPAIGGTAPAAGTFTTLTGNSTSQFGRSSANYFQAIGAAANLTPEISVLGSDTNIPFTIETKGTGAINLSAGSRGVNVANGQTVTAIARTAAGSNYTSVPSVAISAPTTAGGVQATATALVFASGVTIQSGGTGYSLNDVLTVTGGTFTTAAQLTVSSVSGGVITGVTISTAGSYSVTPANPVSVTGGTGAAATFNLTYGVTTTFTITNAGSGYVEQPTVTFSGGGGSGATAVATIGSATSIKTLNDTTFFTPSGPVLSFLDSANPGTGAYLQLSNSSTVNAIQRASGTGTNIGIYWVSKGTGSHSFATNNSTATEQLRVSHTASAVNYVQVTGAATTARPAISAQGSDTNIDLALTPKGTGLVRFGTYTATVSTITGYIEIKDSGGTTRRLAVVS